MIRTLFAVILICGLSVLCRAASANSSSSAPSATQLDSCTTWALSLIPEDHRPTIEHLNDFLYNYQQSAPAYEDPLGDFALAALTDETTMRLVKATVFKDANHGVDASDIHEVYDPNAPLEPAPTSTNELTSAQIRALNISDFEKEKMLVDLDNSKLVIEGRVNPVRVQPMIDAITQVIREESRNGIAPTEGSPHVWSKDFTDHCSERYLGMKLSKILEALGRGDSSRFMMTAEDKNLENWIMSQKDSSIAPHELFRQSYRLNHGDVYLTLLTIENVLSRNWRNPHREDLVLIHHLAPMANFYEGRGTNFGVWYHFFGIVYYGYVYGKTDALIMGSVEHIGSLVMGHFAPQMQKGAVNTTGGAIGAGIKKALEKGLIEKESDNPAALDPSKYLNLTEDFRDRIEVWSDPSYSLRHRRSRSRTHEPQAKSQRLPCRVDYG